jgi:hypothetical protein
VRYWTRGLAGVAALGVTLVAGASVSAPAAGPTSFSYEDQPYSASPLYGSITESKPESKLWFADGSWWAIMLGGGGSGFHIFRLDRTSETWIDTGTPVDPRGGSRADALWDASSDKLYVASHMYAEISTASAGSGRVYRFSYQPSAGRFTLDKGFPVTINDAATKSLVIAKDSTGLLWTTWAQDNKIYVTHSVAGTDDRSWAPPYVLPVAGSSVNPDDLSTLIAFGGDQIGLMWSNGCDGDAPCINDDGHFYFAVHRDGAGDGAADWSGGPIPGTPPRDDHINLKTDAAGRVYAAVKFTTSSGPDPLIGLLVRDPSTGDWATYPVGTVSDSDTRPIVLLDEPDQTIHVFYTGPEPPSRDGQYGGTIYEKTSGMGAISFPAGSGTPVISDSDSPDLNNVTSTKQNVDAVTGIVVLASNEHTSTYWHSDLRLDGSTPPAPAPRARPSQPSDTVVFTPVADGDVNSTAPDAHYGAQPSLRVRLDTYRSYLKFNVSGLSGPVSDAVLRLMTVSKASDGGELYAVANDWDEPTLDWATAPPLPPAPLQSVGRVAPGEVDVDLGPGVVTGDGAYSFALAGSTTSSAIYSSREGPNPPQLVIRTSSPTAVPPATSQDQIAPATTPLAPSAAGPRAPARSPAARPATVTVAIARQRASRALAHRLGRRWTAGTSRRIECHPIVHRGYMCHVRWRYRAAQESARVLIAQTSARVIWRRARRAT